MRPNPKRTTLALHNLLTKMYMKTENEKENENNQKSFKIEFESNPLVLVRYQHFRERVGSCCRLQVSSIFDSSSGGDIKEAAVSLHLLSTSRTMQKIALGLLLACSNLGRGRSSCPDQSLNCIEGLQTDKSHTHVFKDGIPLLSSRSDLNKIGRPDEDHIHEVIFVIQSKNMDKLKLIVDDVSDPRSVNYSQHMTREQVVELTSNSESSTDVCAYLQANGASIESVTLGDEFVTAHAPISVWEKLLNTRFHLFEQTHRNGDVTELVRAEEYWISKEIHSHVQCAMNTVEIPIIHRWGRSVAVDADSTMNRKFGDAPGELHEQLITPARLRNYYNMSNSKGNSLSTQVIFAGNYGYFSPSRLRWFQGNVSKQSYQAALIEVDDGFATDNRSIDEDLFSEANLDVQYIMAMSPGSPTTYWHYNDGIARFIRDLASKPKPSLICSISYGLNEQFVSPAEWSVFDEWILKASAMGVTVFVSAGDQGAVGTNIDGVLSRCQYEPSYPSANPYVVSVGATTVRRFHSEDNNATNM